MFDDFLNLMLEKTPEGARVMACQFRGDPNSDIYGKWRAKVIRNSGLIDEGANVYLCVSAMQQNDRGEFRRRKENFAAGILLMIDDVGSGAGAKFPLEILEPLPPTAMIETSRENWQAVYFFREPVEDMKLFDALIRAFIDRQFLGQDTGQAGVNRVFRPPIGVNAKEKHADPETGRPWKVRMTEWAPERQYTVREIADAFELTLVRERRAPRGATNAKADNIRNFIAVRGLLRGAGMLKTEDADRSGWMHVTCPWTGEHTGGVDNGAAIRLPDEENGWTGAFRCHHGHCERKGWRDLTEWLAEESAEVLERVNARAPKRITHFQLEESNDGNE